MLTEFGEIDKRLTIKYLFQVIIKTWSHKNILQIKTKYTNHFLIIIIIGLNSYYKVIKAELIVAA